MEFIGADSDIHIDNREHNDFQWVSIEDAEEIVHEIRREQTKTAIELYRKKIS
jgi:hypothetical protein